MASQLTLEVEGIPELKRTVLGRLDRIVEKGRDGLMAAGEKILELSNTKVPVLTGRLRDSGRVSFYADSKTDYYVVVSYGDQSVLYAIKVHEDLEARHIHGGEAKFLEKAVQEMEKNIGPIIAEKVK